MSKINERELINRKEYVREPVDEKVEEILSSNKSRIIVTGNRGTGKSTVLCALEKRGLGTKEQTIYVSPDPIIFMTKEPSERFNEELFDYIYEAIFVRDILCYIENNYPLAYEKYFKKDKELIVKLLGEFDNQLNSCCYENVTFKTSKEPSEILRRTVYKIYETLNVEKLNVAVDRFDKINGSSEYVQKVYEKDFNIFDKTIIVASDPKLDKERLINSGYDIQKIAYGKNEDVLREIIKRRFLKDEAKKHLYTEDIFINKLVKQGDNIKFSFDVLSRVEGLLSWYGIVHDIEEVIDEAIELEREESKRLQKIIKEPTLYL